MTRWLTRLALRLVPERWRDSVIRDLRDEAASAPQARPAGLWPAWHAVRVGMRFRVAGAVSAIRRLPQALARDLVTDTRLALRMMVRQPVAHVAIVVTLALGIGATAAAYAVFNTILFRPLPGIRDPGALITITLEAPSKPGEWASFSSSRLMDAIRGTTGLDGLAASYRMTVPVVAGPQGDPERLDVMAVRDDYLSVLGVRARLGRLITGTEAAQGAGVAMISERFWRSHFGGSPDAIGARLSVDGRAFEVVGVVAAYEGWGPSRVGTVAVWFTGGSGPELQDRVWKMDAFLVIGRPAPGTTRAGLEARLRDAYRRATPPNDPAAALVPVVRPGLEPEGADDVAREVLAIYPLAMGATAVLLLLACANAANLLLARIARRERALVLRSALGASRGRLLRGIAVESAVLAAGSAIAGLGLAALLTRSLSGVRPFRAGPALVDVPIDWRVAAFASAVAALTLLVFSAAPALAGARVDARGLLQQSGRTTAGRRRTRNALVILQLALALVLVAGAGVLTRSVANLRSLDLGMRPDDVVEFSMDPLDGGAALTAPDAYIRDVLARVEQTSGVDAVGIAAPPAFAPFPARAGRVRASGAIDRPYLEAERRHVSGGYFSTLGIPLIAGRTFMPEEFTYSSRKDGSAGVIVNASLAQRVFGSTAVVGRRLTVARIYGDPAQNAANVEIVGVAGDTRSGWDYLRGAGPVVYEADRASYMVSTFYVRSALPAAVIQGRLRDATRGIEPRIPLRDVMTLRQEFDALFPEDRMIANLMRLVAALAGTLGLLGVASVMACTLAERTRELGIRAALGASTGRLTRDVLRPALVTGIAGVGIGLVLFALVSGGLASHVYGIDTLDPPTLAAAAAVLLLAALAAAWVPTRRAARTNPTIALRAD